VHARARPDRTRRLGAAASSGVAGAEAASRAFAIIVSRAIASRISIERGPRGRGHRDRRDGRLAGLGIQRGEDRAARLHAAAFRYVVALLATAAKIVRGENPWVGSDRWGVS
jgi:hypothetical protein